MTFYADQDASEAILDLKAEHDALRDAVCALIAVYMADGDLGPTVAALEDLTGGQQS